MEVINRLYETINDRKTHGTDIENSYTAYLFKQGLDKMLKKVGEESSEVIIAAKNQNNDELILELSDLIYHLLVLMSQAGITPDDIERELTVREQKTGNKKPSLD